MDYLVSRNRDTGISVELGGSSYFIDIDFFWLNILNTIKDNEYTVIGSNHVMWQLSMMCALKQVLDPKTEFSMILTPYIYESDFNIESFIDTHSEKLQVALLGNLSWRKGNSQWDKNWIKTVSKFQEQDVHFILEAIKNDIINKNILNLEKINKNTIIKLLRK